MTGATRDTLISAQENRQMFDRIARRYDLLNGLMSLGLHRYWRRRAVQSLLVNHGHEFLDIGCGTGDLAIAVMQKAPTTRVTGIDVSPDMLARATVKTQKAGLSDRITYQQADATELPFRDASFDGIISAFCIRNIVDRSAALSEMRRVLRPGGTVAILELAAPRNPVLRLIHNTYTHHLIPLLGRLLSQRSAYQYLADSIDHFPPPQAIVAAMTRSGLTDAAFTSLTGGFVTLYTARTPSIEPRQ